MTYDQVSDFISFLTSTCTDFFTLYISTWWGASFVVIVLLDFLVRHMTKSVIEDIQK